MWVLNGNIKSFFLLFMLALERFVDRILICAWSPWINLVSLNT